jgi:hypothetical protein
LVNNPHPWSTILGKDDERARMWIFYLIIGLWASSVVLELLCAVCGGGSDGGGESSYIHRPNLHP